MNSLCVLTREEACPIMANSSHPSLRCKTILVPLARVSSLSLMVYELALISDSQIHVLSSQLPPWSTP